MICEGPGPCRANASYLVSVDVPAGAATAGYEQSRTLCTAHFVAMVEVLDLFHVEHGDRRL